jgi:hypothetical protein
MGVLISHYLSPSSLVPSCVRFPAPTTTKRKEEETEKERGKTYACCLAAQVLCDACIWIHFLFFISLFILFSGHSSLSLTSARIERCLLFFRLPSLTFSSIHLKPPRVLLELLILPIFSCTQAQNVPLSVFIL